MANQEERDQYVFVIENWYLKTSYYVRYTNKPTQRILKIAVSQLLFQYLTHTFSKFPATSHAVL